jgi:hypothetical protein
MSNNNDTSKAAMVSFHLPSSLKFFRSFTLPDTTFDIYTTDAQEFFAFITTDYADPYYQSRELKNISGKYKFEFENLIKPHNTNYETVAVLPHDEMDGDFFVTAPYKNYKLYYYLANIKIEPTT